MTTRFRDDDTPVGTPADQVTAVENRFGPFHRSTLILDDVPVTVGNTTGVSFGGTKILDFPESRLLILGATIADVAFDLTHADNDTPIDGADGGDVGVGTTVVADGTMTGTDQDIIPATSIDPISNGLAGAALAASAQFDGTTTPVDVYFNILIDDADVGDGASDVVLVSATLSIAWVDLGDF